ncbi:hypothetical protein DL98DRAFT_590489 [Cadophora sp. DSE1049]|nr:hypothetical protein DL98DRAFT_590489 [Cadophora sp. DSE1049]
MGIRLPLEIICEIISHVQLKSDLYNWCLVSRAARDFATPRFYKEIWDAFSIDHSNERRSKTLKGLLQLPSQRLENVRTFEVKNRYMREESPASINEMLDAVESLIRRTTQLEEFRQVDI